MMIFGFSVMMLPVPAYADICDDYNAGKYPGQSRPAICDEEETFEKRIENIINLGYWIAGILAFAMIIFAAVKMMTAQGDPAKIAESKKMLTYTIIGLVVVLVAGIVARFVIGVFM